MMAVVEAKNLFNPQLTFEPEKAKDQFRVYNGTSVHDQKVTLNYELQHTNQTMAYVQQKMAYWCKFDHGEMTIMEILQLLNTLVDETDPDFELANSLHGFQTAEKVRELHPDVDWLHLVGLIHDIGKVMALWGEPQWSTGGDTYPIGCQFSDKIVYGRNSFKNNPDFNNLQYSSLYGIYEPNCGLDNVTMSWGHDEYLYHVMLHNKCSLPEEGLYIIRFHSFYPWHREQEYKHLTNQKDQQMLNWLKEFSKCDLYSKGNKLPDVDALMPYYQGLIDKYMPGKLKW